MTVDLRDLEHQDERRAAAVDDAIAKIGRPSPLLMEARAGYRQACAAVAQARAHAGDTRDEWLAVASAMRAAAGSLARLGGVR